MIRTKKTRPSQCNRGAATTPMIRRRRYNTARRDKQRIFAYRKPSKWGGGGDATHSWRDFYQVHPAAEVFPLLPSDELQKLAKDIEANGLTVPIVTCHVAGKDGGLTYLLDGRNRLDAMESLGRQIVDDKGNWIGALSPVGKNMVEHLVGYTEKQAVAKVLSLNEARRHLSQSQRAAIAAELETMKQGRPGKNATLHVKQVTRSEAANVLRVSPRTVAIAAKLKREAPKAFEDVKFGRTTVSKAAASIKPTKPRKPKQVDKLKPEYIWTRFGMFLRHWPHEQQRKVREWLHGQLSP